VRDHALAYRCKDHQENGTLNSGEAGETASAPNVLIVGTGPAGLFAACELVRHGVVPRIVELRPAPHHETRGTALQPAVLESIDRAGLVEPFLRSSVHIRQVQLVGPGLHEIAATVFSGTGSKYGFQCSLPQWRTETILRDHLAARSIAIEYGTDVKSIEDDPAGLRVTLETDGRTEVLTTAYVLGAGGAHSVTRHSMQEKLTGDTYSGQFIVADLKARLPCPPECGRVFVGASGFVLFSPLPDDRWLIFVNRDTTDERSELPTTDELGALLNTRVGIDLGVHDVRWVSYFRMHKRATARLGDGRRFLLGDAGHLSSPMGGEGVNAALMDAADIAWKLALVVRGAARPALLESYAVERGLADRHVLDVSDEVHGFVMKLIGMCEGGRVPVLPPEDPAESKASARRRLMLDVSYEGSEFVGWAGADATGLPPGTRFPGWLGLGGPGHHLVVVGKAPPLDRFRARWGELVSIVDASAVKLDAVEAGVPNGGAILVRPDGFIGFRAAPADDAAIKALDAHLATYLVPSMG
jgi:2-polyprenyl-6-methoxyphenol hydroxylase-like FAD-dependent oxidoreductase